MTLGNEQLRSGITARLAADAVALRFETLTPDALRVARQCVIDWLGVTIAARRDPLVEMLAAEAAEEGGHSEASLVGRDAKVSRLQAALINGAASHALDYDDVHGQMLGHPTVTLVPALLAAAQGRAVSGARFLESFVTGYETLVRIARLVNPEHYDHGFHSTGTLGSFAAATACSKLMGLDVDQTAGALGIAATSTSGLKSMFGTMCKPLHAGYASRNGLSAARLAARGFTTRPDAIEAEQGFAATHSKTFNLAAALAPAPRGFHVLDTLFKYHAACYGTHGAIEATRQALGEDSGSIARLKSVRVRASKRMQRVCSIPDPQNGLQAKFSVRATVAFVLAGLDTAGIASYSDERVRSDVVRQLIERVEVEWVDQASDMGTEVELLFDGRPSRKGSFDPGIPLTDLNRQQSRIETKFLALVSPEFGEVRARQLLAELNRLDSVADIDSVLAIAR